MYAVVKVGSYQYKVSEGDEIQPNRLKEKEGKSMNLDKVLLYTSGHDIRIGQPFLKDVSVTAQVVTHTLDEKKIAFKYRKRKDSCRKIGHRQKLTVLSITKITAK